MKTFAGRGLAALAILLLGTAPTLARPIHPTMEQRGADPDVMCLVAILTMVMVMEKSENTEDAQQWLPRLRTYVIFYRGKIHDRYPKGQIEPAMETALADLRALPDEQSVEFLNKCTDTAAEALGPTAAGFKD